MSEQADILVGAVTIDGPLAEVRFSDGQAARFDSMWLRDNCPCPFVVIPKAARS